MTSAISPAAASRCTRTAAPCGATDVTVPGHRLRAEPVGSPTVRVTADGREAGADVARGPGWSTTSAAPSGSRIDVPLLMPRSTLSPTSRATWSVRRTLRDLGGGARPARPGRRR